jgi:hypothetical protein
VFSSLDSGELLIMAGALVLGGFFKGVTGVGLPLVTVPVLATFVGVERAVLLMVLPSLTLNAYQAWAHRDEAGRVPEIWRIVAAGVPGAALGASVLHFAGERLLASMLAAWIVAYVAFRIAHPVFAMSLGARMRWSPAVGAGAGALQAATGISAPIIAAYVDSLGLAPRAYVFAVCAAFGAFAAAHFALVAASGVYTQELLIQSLAAIVPAVAFIPVGAWARKFLSRRAFDWVIRVTLVIMAARLLLSAWFGDAGD